MRSGPRWWSAPGTEEADVDGELAVPITPVSGADPGCHPDGAVPQTTSLGVVQAVVLGQYVVTEVVGRVAPRRVDVVAVCLRVVMLDEQRRPLGPEVVPLPRFGAARPREAEVVQPGPLQVVQLRPGHLVGQPPRERP